MPEKYECDQCGACCQGHLIVEADLWDIQREPRLLEAAPQWANHSPAQLQKEFEEPGRCIILAAGTRGCLFLDGEKRCAIYSTRPHDCVAMQAGDEQCQMSRQEAGLLPLEPVAKARDPCECEEPGHFCSGVPGILAHIEEGKVAPDAKVERCDLCRRFPSDDTAREQLRKLGMIPANETASRSYTVECFVIFKAGLAPFIANGHKDAVQRADAVFDRKTPGDHRANIDRTSQFHEYHVRLNGDTSTGRTRVFDSNIQEKSQVILNPVVWLLSIYGKLGRHITVCKSYKSAKQALFGYVKEQWEEEFESEPLPDDAETTIRRYFDRSAESYDIQDVNVV